jgi:hypothetical protein
MNSGGHPPFSHRHSTCCIQPHSPSRPPPCLPLAGAAPHPLLPRGPRAAAQNLQRAARLRDLPLGGGHEPHRCDTHGERDKRRRGEGGRKGGEERLGATGLGFTTGGCAPSHFLLPPPSSPPSLLPQVNVEGDAGQREVVFRVLPSGSELQPEEMDLDSHTQLTQPGAAGVTPPGPSGRWEPPHSD